MINVISFNSLGLEFKINRVAFYIGDFNVYWYGIIIAIGLTLALIYGIKECKKVCLSLDDFYNMVLICIPTAIICARIYYVVFSFDMYKDNLLSVFDIRNGGIAIYGGIIGTFLAIFIYCRIKHIKIGIPLDMLAVGLLIGQTVGRWGNFVNAEAFGTSTTLPWAMTIKSGLYVVAESVHPTFLYESLWNAVGIIILLLFKKHKKFEGEVFALYMAWYGLGRTLIEGLRADSLYIGSIRVSQLLSLIIIVSGLLIITINRIKLKNKK